MNIQLAGQAATSTFADVRLWLMEKSIASRDPTKVGHLSRSTCCWTQNYNAGAKLPMQEVFRKKFNRRRQ